MNYKLQANGTPTSDGVGDASDADEDVAAALIFAAKKWGDSGRLELYRLRSKRVITQSQVLGCGNKLYVQYRVTVQPETSFAKPSHHSV